ncbi:type VI secretion protein [Photobacterium swingsii]|uniref:Type VI secretion system contractile sheath large subunit n=1 Tax=Photobacterium swingsii TaxID=680026 RepID=A0A0J8VEN4_9GAMM|nr:type VI secretion system contractile sheath large subunit [Photobacterium swingsii]KMV31746.1 type VI secretion protein [Photobacterium swingsii]PSW25357.1 type VI secretion system contractile sheath large subunit [Photobacterium swingsii]
MVNENISFVSELFLSSGSPKQQEIHDLYSKSQLVDAFLDTKDDALSLRMWLDIHTCFNKGECNKQSLTAMLLAAITAIDEKISQQLDAILHNDSLKKLEASWRGLAYLVEQENEYDTEQKCRVKLLHLTWSELTRDSAKAIDFDQSDFFRVIYNNEFNMPGGEPFGLLIGDYKITHRLQGNQHANDVDTLRKISQTAAASFAPFITSADPSFFGVDKFSELASVAHIETQFSQPEYIEWQSVRAMEDAKFLGITLPDILLRSPYTPDGSRREQFSYRESLSHSESDYLWGNAAYAFAAVTVRAFCESGWFSHIRGVQAGKYRQGLVVKVPQSHFCVTRRLKKNKMSVNLQVGDRLEKQLSDSGFIPVSSVYETGFLSFYSNSSVNESKQFSSESDAVNARLASMLQYILCVSRFAHYIKVIGRDKIGSFETADQIERYFQKWLMQYTTSSDSLSEEMRSKYPLHEARIRVKEKLGNRGCFYSVIHLRPHFQLDQMVSNIRLITELSPISN